MIHIWLILAVINVLLILNDLKDQERLDKNDLGLIFELLYVILFLTNTHEGVFMLKRYDCEIETEPYTGHDRSVMEEYVNGEFVRYSDIKDLVEVAIKLIGRHGYTPNDIQNGIDRDEVNELLNALETEVMNLER